MSTAASGGSGDVFLFISVPSSVDFIWDRATFGPFGTGLLLAYLKRSCIFAVPREEVN